MCAYVLCVCVRLCEYTRVRECVLENVAKSVQRRFKLSSGCCGHMCQHHPGWSERWLDDLFLSVQEMEQKSVDKVPEQTEPY